VHSCRAGECCAVVDEASYFAAEALPTSSTRYGKVGRHNVRSNEDDKGADEDNEHEPDDETDKVGVIFIILGKRRPRR
jgi:hypothetical protein